MASEVDHYRAQSPYTDPGASAPWLDGLRRDVAALRDISQDLVFHYRAHGDLSEHGFERSRLGEIDLRYADLQFARLRELRDAPLTEPRTPTERLLGCCRDNAVLFVSMARHVGIPARVRVGFASYLVPGWYVDHVIAEVWDEDERRWRLIDPDVPRDHSDPIGAQPLDVVDVPRDRFVVGARAWQMARSGRVDADRFVVHPDVPLPFLRGLTYLAHNLVFDLAGLNRHEPLLWDSWGLLLDEAPPDESRIAELDRIADRLESPDVTIDELEQLFSADDVRIPEAVVTESPPVRTTTRLRRG